MPLLRKGIGIAKPHLKTAAKNIVSDVVSNVIRPRHQENNQEGSGLHVVQRRAIYRPPGARRRVKHRRVKTHRVKVKKYNAKPKKGSVLKRRASRQQRRSRPAKKRRLSIF